MKNKPAFSTIIFRLSHRLNSLCEIVASLFLLLMLVLVIIQVVARYIFDAPPPMDRRSRTLLHDMDGTFGGHGILL